MSRVLLADDNSLARSMGRQVLSEEGHEVIIAADGSEALAFLNEQSPGIVIVGTGLTGISGIDLCKQIKSNPGLDHVKVLLLAGPREILGETELAGAEPDGILHKPLDPEAVAKSVRDLSVDAMPSGAPPPAGDNGQPQSTGEASPNSDAESKAPAQAAAAFDSAAKPGSDRQSASDPLAAVVETLLRRERAPHVDREQVRSAVAEVMESAMPAIIDRVAERVLEVLRKGRPA